MCTDEIRKRRTILHETDILNIWHFRTPDAVFDPTHNITQNALNVIFKFARYALFIMGDS